MSRGSADDIAYCAHTSSLQVVPVVLEAAGGIATVVPAVPVRFEPGTEPRYARK